MIFSSSLTIQITNIDLDFVKHWLTMSMRSTRPNIQSLDGVLLLLTCTCAFVTQVQIVIEYLSTVNTRYFKTFTFFGILVGNFTKVILWEGICT